MNAEIVSLRAPARPGNFWFTSGVEVKTGDSDAW